MPIWRIALFVSLGLNLFIVGWWVGDTWRQPRPMEPRPFSMRPVAESRLSPETVDLLQPSLEAMDDLLEQAFKARVDLFDDLTEAVRAEPYDRGHVDELLAQLVQNRTAAETQQWRLVGETLAGLSADQRAAFAEIVFVRPGPQLSWSASQPPPPMPRQ